MREPDQNPEKHRLGKLLFFDFAANQAWANIAALAFKLVSWVQLAAPYQTSSWLNQVERFFGFVTEDLLRRSVHALESDICNWVKTGNENPEPFTWTKRAEQILESIGRLLNRISGAGH